LHAVFACSYDAAPGSFTTRRDQGGTGLGLHIVYSIVTTRLGGRLDLDSEPGGGTRIQMILPRVAPLEQAAE
jgi:signal transduction histidine kinase